MPCDFYSAAMGENHGMFDDTGQKIPKRQFYFYLGERKLVG